MTGWRLMAAILFAAAAQGASAAGAGARAELERLAGAHIFFAHQSVGENILEGMRELADREGAPRPHLDDLRVPENGDPERKIREFEAALERRGGRDDIALLKFCYVDIGPQTNVAALFERYRAAMERLELRYPRVTFVHVTVPLTVEQTGIKAAAKRLLGRHPYGTLENVRREEYNALLRAAYLGREPVFDLAALESVAPDGSAVSVVWDGRKAPALARAYASDGAHLNEAGSLLAARRLLHVLATAVAKAAPWRAAAAAGEPTAVPR